MSNQVYPETKKGDRDTGGGGEKPRMKSTLEEGIKKKNRKKRFHGALYSPLVHRMSNLNFSRQDVNKACIFALHCNLALSQCKGWGRLS